MSADSDGVVLADHGIVDADSMDGDDPNTVSDYVRPIYQYFKSIEVCAAMRPLGAARRASPAHRIACPRAPSHGR